MIRRSYDAILLDLDGTLVDDTGRVPGGTLAALAAARERGVRVMIATGRSELATAHVLHGLGLESLAVVYNGAAVYCPRRDLLIEERVLANRTVERSLEIAKVEGFLPVVMRAGAKFAPPPRDAEEEAAIGGLHGISVVEAGELPRESLIRITLFARELDHVGVENRVRRALDHPVYLTSFPLAMLPDHRKSRLSVVDLHPPCRGKAEALRALEEYYGIPRERVVAVGDAMNDIPMLLEAGLAVAMEHASPDVLESADRVIGGNNTDTIGDLVSELFGPFDS